jgi:hypothetical protein
LTRQKQKTLSEKQSKSRRTEGVAQTAEPWPPSHANQCRLLWKRTENADHYSAASWKMTVKGNHSLLTGYDANSADPSFKYMQGTEYVINKNVQIQKKIISRLLLKDRVIHSMCWGGGAV